MGFSDIAFPALFPYNPTSVDSLSHSHGLNIIWTQMDLIGGDGNQDRQDGVVESLLIVPVVGHWHM